MAINESTARAAFTPAVACPDNLAVSVGGRNGWQDGAFDAALGKRQYVYKTPGVAHDYAVAYAAGYTAPVTPLES